LLADIGEGIREVELLQWYVAEGDRVRQFDTVCQVQSDKATVDITSRYDGTVTELCGAGGQMMRVGEPLLYVRVATDEEEGGGGGGGDDKGTPPSLGAPEETSRPVAGGGAPLPVMDERLRVPSEPTRHTLSDHGDGGSKREKFHASPAVRRLVAEHDIAGDVASGRVRGTGPAGRVLKSDVIAYLRERGRWEQKTGEGVEEEVIPGSATATTKAPGAAATPAAAAAAPMTTGDDDAIEVVQLRGYQRSMVSSMTASLQVPHLMLGDDVVVDALLEARRTFKADDTDISMLAIWCKACSLALAEYPALNATAGSVEACEVQLHRHHHVGIAVDTPRGLVVPVVRSVQDKTLAEIQGDLNRLRGAAASGNVPPEDLTGATFMLSNIGSMGVGTVMMPCLVPPLIAMGAVGRIKRVPAFDENDNVVPTNIQSVSWAADHRFVDGATVARFHAVVQKYIENPIHMLSKLS
jgi:2-oxoisovalerate dehydrogenase E2 component (dihydrolipoyl transacylase)